MKKRGRGIRMNRQKRGIRPGWRGLARLSAPALLLSVAVALAGPTAHPAGNPTASVPEADTVGAIDTDVADSTEIAELTPPENSPPVWMDFYAEGGNEPNENNDLAAYGELKIGKRIELPLPLDIYGKLRAGHDRDGNFWHNRDDLGLGLRLFMLHDKATLFAMVEAVRGRYVADRSLMERRAGSVSELTALRAEIDQLQRRGNEIDRQIFFLQMNRGSLDTLQATVDSLNTQIRHLQTTLDSLQNQGTSLSPTLDNIQAATDSMMRIPVGLVVEYRAGLIFQKSWGYDNPGTTAAIVMPWRLWGDLYGECFFQDLRRKIRARTERNEYADSTYRYQNLILTLAPKIGVVALEGIAGMLIPYGEAEGIVDIRGDWYNNKATACLGIRYKPVKVLDLVIDCEYALGTYFGRERPEDPNPYTQTFANFRVGASFWYGLGL
jgi:hypothetical protein